MVDNFLIPIGATFLTVLGAIVGYFIKDFLDKKKEINSKNNEVKREMYKDFVSITLKLLKPQKRKTPVNIIDPLYRFYEKYVLYSSPAVINSVADFMQYTFKNAHKADVKVTLKKLSRVLINMRKEIGLSNRGLGKDGERIFRAMFKDFDQLK